MEILEVYCEEIFMYQHLKEGYLIENGELEFSNRGYDVID